ncbi:STAS/SEC14 domain-containing protein [Methanobacterium ferruginis]|uniref:STAS/SEC14 domain-containing protein n=1 Tax=Methanobacterium ferruginis TaxID=710191 RepID=UPI00257436B4|nr:STAS/SEC14 domain-containing protein [Methanobacterium ferruginis]BDZ68220.1 hypothetical protein GCM10025860_16680 [Methanobacterium ferruginis]
MIEKMDKSNRKVLGFRLIGDVSKSDYDVMVPVVQSVIDKEGSASLLIDLEEFKWEKVEAWGADLNFGRTYHERIDKIAIVGDKHWEELLTVFSKAYAHEAKYFHTSERNSAWEWLQEQNTDK